MRKEVIYANYYTNHYSNGVNSDIYYKDYARFLDKSLGKLFHAQKRQPKILDLGCGFWWFAYYCSLYGYKLYEWCDLSVDEIGIAKSNFPEYKFSQADIFDYLENLNEKYDIIFMSMVFEHLTIDQAKRLIELIYKKLTPWWIFINYQPNADSYFNSVSSLYIDITHERLWNWNSYTQFIKSYCDIRGIYELEFRNSYIWKNLFEHLCHKIVKFFFELFLLLMGYDKKKIYTKSFYSILKKS